MTWLWALIGLLLGGFIGHFLHAWRCRNSVRTSTSTASAVNEESEKLRHRVANLESAVGERDKLKLRVGELENELKVAKAAPAAAPVAAFAGVAQADHDSVVGERDQLKARISSLQADLDACHAARNDGEVKIQGLMSDNASLANRRVKPDNLKLIVGIGPVLEQILNAAGVFTFEQIVAEGVAGIQDILPDMQDARVEKENWIPQAKRFADAKAAGQDPESIARDEQIT
jgi:predicted flap endonuclease-1-like 5' DNA nuclease